MLPFIGIVAMLGVEICLAAQARPISSLRAV